MNIAWTEPGDAPALAAAHALVFAAPWGAAEFESLLQSPGVFGLLIEARALALCRVVADEMEVLTIGVAPLARRQGLAKALLAAALQFGRQAGASKVFLEVAADNGPAINLYERLGFHRTGVRKGYYARAGHANADAIVMHIDLASAGA